MHPRKTDNSLSTDPIVASRAPGRVLVHACCAPCSGAILEWLLQRGWQPTLFFCNPNIWPAAEHDRRAAELLRHAHNLGIDVEIDTALTHDDWRRAVAGLEDEPERGARCERCFAMRLKRAAEWGEARGFDLLTTTLSSSRWKSLEQIGRAGAEAVAPTGLTFWARNWRKEGLQQRRDEIVKEQQFYNQQYCGCEFSLRPGCEVCDPETNNRR